MYVATGKPVTLATLVNQIPVTVGHTFPEPANVYDIMHGHYTITGHLFVLNLGHTFPSSAMCKFNIPVMADMKNCRCFRGTCCLHYQGSWISQCKAYSSPLMK